MPTVWRIVKSAQIAAAFDGEGARRYGGRWNSPGTALVYMAQSRSLAALELLVHLREANLLSSSYALIPATFEAALVEAVDPASLPVAWQEYPAPIELQQLGDQWAAQRRSAVLQVPSAVMPVESNFLLNPHHPEFARISLGRAEPFRFDRRLK